MFPEKNQEYPQQESREDGETLKPFQEALTVNY